MTESDMIDGMFVFEIDHQATEPFPGCNQRKDCQSVDFCFAECIVNQWLESWIRFVSIDYDSPIGVDKLPKGRLFIQIRFTRPGERFWRDSQVAPISTPPAGPALGSSKKSTVARSAGCNSWADIKVLRTASGRWARLILRLRSNCSRVRLRVLRSASSTSFWSVMSSAILNQISDSPTSFWTKKVRVDIQRMMPSGRTIR